jgi:hypothetical protein
MKKLLLILLCLPMIGFGQLTYVPDDNFEATFFLKKKGLELRDNESIVKKKSANHLVGNEFVGGKLYLTNQRVVFKSHRLNINNHQISFELTKIQGAVKSKLLNGMIIILKDGEKKPFVVWGRKKWINEINNLIQ